MNTSTEEVMKRLSKCELELQAARGYIKALEYGLHAVIASNTAPAALADLWTHVLPEVVDLHGGDATHSALFDAAFQAALAGLSEHIRGAADRDSSGTAMP